jgi:hypothetical protein
MKTKMLDITQLDGPQIKFVQEYISTGLTLVNLHV